MPRTGLTAMEIRAKAIDATLARMRRHGFEKVRLSEVARDLGVSHAALYLHFADKAALLDAVTERWLSETDAQLEELCRADDDPLQKIRNWFLKTYQLKRERVLSDPELYRAFDVAAALRKPYVVAHLERVKGQLAGLVQDAEGALGHDAPERQAVLLSEAMVAFHHPQLVAERVREDREPLLKQILDTVLNGMRRPLDPAPVDAGSV